MQVDYNYRTIPRFLERITQRNILTLIMVSILEILMTLGILTFYKKRCDEEKSWKMDIDIQFKLLY